MPEEDNTKYFIISLILQQLYREILVVADENGGKLDNRVVFSVELLQNQRDKKYLVLSSSGITKNTAVFCLQNISASIAVSKHSICSSSESRKEFSLESAVERTDCMDCSAVFLVMPEEDNTKYFIISLILQQLYREILDRKSTRLNSSH